MKLSRWALALWNAIKKFTALYGDRGCFFSQKWFADQIRRKTRTVQYALAELVKAGIVEVEKRYKRTNLYRLIKQPVAPQNCGSEPLRGTVSLGLVRRVLTTPLVLFVERAWKRFPRKVTPKPRWLVEQERQDHTVEDKKALATLFEGMPIPSKFVSVRGKA